MTDNRQPLADDLPALLRDARDILWKCMGRTAEGIIGRIDAALAAKPTPAEPVAKFQSDPRTGQIALLQLGSIAEGQLLYAAPSASPATEPAAHWIIIDSARPGCNAHGDTEDEARRELADAQAAWDQARAAVAQPTEAQSAGPTVAHRERQIAAMVTWLSANQPDVWRRGMFDAIGDLATPPTAAQPAGVDEAAIQEHMRSADLYAIAQGEYAIDGLQNEESKWRAVCETRAAVEASARRLTSATQSAEPRTDPPTS